MQIKAARAIAVMIDSHPVGSNPFTGRSRCHCGYEVDLGESKSAHVAELIAERFGLQDVEVPIQ